MEERFMEDVLGTPSAADLDAVAAEQAAAIATNTKEFFQYSPLEYELKAGALLPIPSMANVNVVNIVTREEFQTEIMALRSEIEQLKNLVKSLGALVEGHDADIEGFENRIAAFNQRSTHKL